MRILVTGATGFTGSHLTRRLLARGHQVVGLDNQRGLFFDELRARGAELRIGSVADRNLVSELTRGCQQVFHLAAAFRKVNLPKSVYWDVNVEGTRHVMEAALRHGVDRVLYCSTCGVHGNVESPPAHEGSPVAPKDYYQYTKWEGERILPEFLDRGLWVTTVRPAAIYGPGDPARFLMLFRRAARGSFVMLGDGSTHYHPLYIANFIDAMEQAIASDAARGRAYLIADETSTPIGRLVTEVGRAIGVDVRIRRLPFWPVYAVAAVCEICFKLLPAEPPIFRRRVDWFRQNRSFDITRAKREIGYAPRVGLSEGLARTARWYRDEGYLPEGRALLPDQSARRAEGSLAVWTSRTRV